MSGPSLLSVVEVMARYRLKDRRAARRLMDEAGAFKVASKLYVRASDLDAHEQALIAARRDSAGREEPMRAVAGKQARPARQKARTVHEPLRPGWWRRQADGENLDGPTNDPGGGR